jgi:protein-S-isoprenylcysteine O-methyltransferase Ste14
MTVITPIHKPANQKRRLLWIKMIYGPTLLLLVFSQPVWNERAFAVLQILGLTTIVCSIVGRLWCILYIGAKKNVELVQDGPYSMSRNPLYLCSITSSVGIGLFCGSLMTASLLGITMSVVFVLTARRESEFLRSKFGSDYSQYEKRTPLLIPNPKLYQRADSTEFSPKALEATLLDSIGFLIIVPLAATVAALQSLKVMPVLFYIY